MSCNDEFDIQSVEIVEVYDVIELFFEVSSINWRNIKILVHELQWTVAQLSKTFHNSHKTQVSCKYKNDSEPLTWTSVRSIRRPCVNAPRKLNFHSTISDVVIFEFKRHSMEIDCVIVI